MFRFSMMLGRTGGTRFFDCVSRVLQPFANGPFSGLCAMLNRLARFFRGPFQPFDRFSLLDPDPALALPEIRQLIEWLLMRNVS
jgi:hypothetical protein